MSISSQTLDNGRDSNVESLQDRFVGGRISRCAGPIISDSPSFKRSLKTSLSTLTLGSLITTSLLGGGSRCAGLYENIK